MLVQNELGLIPTLCEDELAAIYKVIFEVCCEFDYDWAPDRDKIVSSDSFTTSTPSGAQSNTSSGTSATSTAAGSLSPLADYNQRGDVVGLLKKHDWDEVSRTANGVVQVRRPGKSESNSATFNYKGSRRLGVFSTSTDFTQLPTTHSGADVFAILECGGDIKVAAKKLRELGYGAANGVISQSNGTPPLLLGNNTPAITADYPAPKRMSSKRRNIKNFDLTLVPAPLQTIVNDIVETIKCPIEVPAVAIMVEACAMAKRRFVIQPKKFESEWREYPNMWGMIIGGPSTARTPAINAVLKPIHKMESAAIQEFAAAKVDFAKKVQLGGAVGPPPTLKRYICNNATAPALAGILIEDPSLLVFQDELTGLLEQVSRPEGADLRSLLLTGWSGQNSYTLDRIGRGVRAVPPYSLSVLGGIQPSRFDQYLMKHEQTRASGDGLLQRFTLLVAPEPSEEWAYVDTEFSREGKKQMYNASDFLDHGEILAPAEESCIPCFKFDEEAQMVFIQWLTNLEREIRDPDISGVMSSHLGKYKKAICSLSAVIQLIENNEASAIGVDALNKAVRWLEVMRSHAEHIFSGAPIVADEVKTAQRLFAKLANGGYADGKEFAVHEIRTKGWTGFGGQEAIHQALRLLEAHDWVQLKQSPSGAKGGRPATRYHLNPRAVKLKSDLLA